MKFAREMSVGIWRVQYIIGETFSCQCCALLKFVMYFKASSKQLFHISFSALIFMESTQIYIHWN